MKIRIEWTDFAVDNLKNIFDYYANKANKTVAHKIRKQILTDAKKLIEHPQIGPIESNLLHLNKNHRYLVSGNYKLIYRTIGDKIIINDVFDTRQDPSLMNDENRNKR